MLKLLENLFLGNANLSGNYKVVTENKQLELGRIRLKLETAKSETYLLTIDGSYLVSRYREIPASYNILVDLDNVKIERNNYIIPENYIVTTATEQLQSLLSDIQNEKVQFVITDDNVILNIKHNPISKIYMLGTDTNRVVVPIFSEVHRLQTVQEQV